MRINAYTEELLDPRADQPLAEIVTTKYISSRTGEEMTNYGIRIYFKSHPDLHYIPGRDDDRSAITIWVGPKEKKAFEFLEAVRQQAYASTMVTWREKTEKVQAEAEAALKT